MQVTGTGSEAKERIAESRSAIEAIDPAIAERELVFQWTDPHGAAVEKKYIQAELGMFPAQEFATKITEILEQFTEGEMGAKIGDLFRGDVEMPTVIDANSVNDVVEENMSLVQAFIQLVKIVPDLQLDIMCLSLGIDRREWPWAKEQMQEPPRRGGLTVEEGFDILIWFIRQNAKLLRETFLGKAKELVDVFRLEVLQQGLEEVNNSSSEEKDSTEEEPEIGPIPPAPSPGGMPSSTSSQPTPASG